LIAVGMVGIVGIVGMISPLIGPPPLGIVTPITDQSATLDAKNMNILTKFFNEGSYESAQQNKVKPDAPQS